jgi:type I restriction enzyme S subunit
MAIVPESITGANITQDSARIAPKVGIEVAFLVGYLESQTTQQEMRRLTKGVAVKGINLGDLKVLQVPVPSQELQADFAARFLKACEVLSMQSRALETAVSAFDALLARAFEEGV